MDNVTVYNIILKLTPTEGTEEMLAISGPLLIPEQQKVSKPEVQAEHIAVTELAIPQLPQEVKV